VYVHWNLLTTLQCLVLSAAAVTAAVSVNVLLNQSLLVQLTTETTVRIMDGWMKLWMQHESCVTV